MMPFRIAPNSRARFTRSGGTVRRRWFVFRKVSSSMSDPSPVSIRVRDNGPLLLEGAVTIFDAEGRAFPQPADKPVIALCRCGHSGNRPFCDGSHKTCNFQAAERAS